MMKLTARLILLFLVLATPWMAAGQFSAEHAALNNLRKSKWERAKSQSIKAIRKDSLNTGAYYALSSYYFSAANPAFQIDSAYKYVLEASRYFQIMTDRQRDRLRRLPVDSLILLQHRERIDSAAFERAKLLNTEGSYIDFLNHFQFASQRDRAVELRNEVAYLDAMKVNTYDAFKLYLEKYPQSERAPEAKTRYEKLLYEAKTHDKKLLSYESFLTEYPGTTYRKDAERHIFEIMTASGEVHSFEAFLKKYPQSSAASLARNIGYYLCRESELKIPSVFLNDSISNVQQLEKFYLVPFLRNDRFGFMNERGEEIIKPEVSEVDDYLCGNVTDELLLVDKKILARNGGVLYTGKIESVEELGFGFLKIIEKGCLKVMHYSGFWPLKNQCVQDVEIVGEKYLAIKKNNRWALYSFAGRPLVPHEWDKIYEVNHALVFQRGTKLTLLPVKEAAKAADQLPIIFSREYDEVNTFPNEMVWVRRGNEQAVLNRNLKEWIPLANQDITPAFFGAVGKTSIGDRLYTLQATPSANFFRTKINKPWVAVQQEGRWQFIDPLSKQVVGPVFDSVAFLGPFSVGVRGDSLRVYLSPTAFVETLHSSTLQFLPGRDSLFFLQLGEGEKRTLYNAKGERVLSAVYDQIEYNDEGFFTVLKKNKRGLINMEGRVIAQPEFDALGTVSQGTITVLKDRKFGFLDIVNRREIKPEYERNLVRYSATNLIAFKDGGYGLIGWDNKPVIAFECEEIRYWNDSTALIRKNFNWSLYNFVERIVVMDKIKSFKWVTDTRHEKVLIVRKENSYGVISSAQGEVIPATFTYIKNLGSSGTPLYFTEKSVEEASIFVVIYYDKNGMQLRRQVYEADDYEKLYCQEN